MVDSVAPVAIVVPNTMACKAKRNDDCKEICNLGSTQMAMKAIDPKTVKTIIISAPVLIAAINQALNGLFDIRDTIVVRGPKKDSEMSELEDAPQIDYLS